MKNRNNYEDEIRALLATIDKYYDFSFRIENSRCIPLLIQFIEQLEVVLPLLENQSMLQAYLLDIMEAMEKEDEVRLRDVLYYDVKPALQKILNI